MAVIDKAMLKVEARSGGDGWVECQLVDSPAFDYGNRTAVVMTSDILGPEGLFFDTRYVSFAEYEEDVPPTMYPDPNGHGWVGLCAYELQARRFKVVGWDDAL